MKTCLAEVIQVPEADISVKAITSEKMGFVGREESVATHAVALVYRK